MVLDHNGINTVLVACCSLPHSVTHDIASYLVQQYVTLCSESLLDAVWDSCFSRHIVEMARHRVANFILQTVITRIHTKQQVCYLLGNYSML